MEFVCDSKCRTCDHLHFRRIEPPPRASRNQTVCRCATIYNPHPSQLDREQLINAAVVGHSTWRNALVTCSCREIAWGIFDDFTRHLAVTRVLSSLPQLFKQILASHEAVSDALEITRLWGVEQTQRYWDGCQN